MDCTLGSNLSVLCGADGAYRGAHTSGQFSPCKDTVARVFSFMFLRQQRKFVFALADP